MVNTSFGVFIYVARLLLSPFGLPVHNEGHPHLCDLPNRIGTLSGQLAAVGVCGATNALPMRLEKCLAT